MENKTSYTPSEIAEFEFALREYELRMEELAHRVRKNGITRREIKSTLEQNFSYISEAIPENVRDALQLGVRHRFLSLGAIPSVREFIGLTFP